MNDPADYELEERMNRAYFYARGPIADCEDQIEAKERVARNVDAPLETMSRPENY